MAMYPELNLESLSRMIEYSSVQRQQVPQSGVIPAESAFNDIV